MSEVTRTGIVQSKSPPFYGRRATESLHTLKDNWEAWAPDRKFGRAVSAGSLSGFKKLLSAFADRGYPVTFGSVSDTSTEMRGIRHTVEVQAESLFEAAILGVRTFRGDPWIEHVGPATVLDIEVREPAAKHAITMMQWSVGLRVPRRARTEGVKKAKLKDLPGSR